MKDAAEKYKHGFNSFEFVTDTFIAYIEFDKKARELGNKIVKQLKNR